MQTKTLPDSQYLLDRSKPSTLRDSTHQSA